jgi:hypothetical protein
VVFDLFAASAERTESGDANATMSASVTTARFRSVRDGRVECSRVRGVWFNDIFEQ